MPSFVGQPLGSATQTVQDAGLQVGSVTAAPPPEGSSGTPDVAPIPRQHDRDRKIPPAGEKVLTGATVNFEVR